MKVVKGALLVIGSCLLTLAVLLGVTKVFGEASVARRATEAALCTFWVIVGVSDEYFTRKDRKSR